MQPIQRKVTSVYARGYKQQRCEAPKSCLIAVGDDNIYHSWTSACLANYASAVQVQRLLDQASLASQPPASSEKGPILYQQIRC